MFGMGNSAITNKIPSEQDAISIFERATGKSVVKITRLPTGSQHYVYDVLTTNDQHLVIRIGIEESRGHFSGSVYWHKILLDLGIPLPEFLSSEVEQKDFTSPFIIMEKLAGKDLGEVYPQLSSEQKKKLALDISTIQKKVGSLQQGPGFGYANSYTDDSLKSSWLELIHDQLQRTKIRTSEANIFQLNYFNKVIELVNNSQEYLLSVTPVPFLDDTTTKNVIVNNGKLSGIVDIDFICFGDPLYVVALAQMGLLSSGYDTEYIKYWCKNLDLSTKQQKILSLYTLIHCVGFMSELGHQFNKDKPAKIPVDAVKKLEDIFNKLYQGLQ